MRAGPVGGRLAVDQQPLLARLDPPHIARLLAAELTPDGPVW